MRIWVMGLVVLALAACDSSGVPSPAERLERDDSAALAEVVDPGQVTLRADGLVAGPEAFYFAAGQREVEAALSRALGKPGDVMEMPECGAGPMQSSAYAGGLTVNYQNGVFVGWFLDEATENIGFDGLAIGAPRAEVEAVAGFSLIEGSTLGEEFMLGDQLAGFIEEDAVSMLYAGTQCFFR